ncbi:MAG: hypothetical protein ACFFEV_10795 [Candidatus Thorarchaeota archaeon]
MNLQRLPIEDCFDRKGNTYRFQKITKKYIEFLKPFGHLEVFDSFPKPFFRLNKPGFFRLKGTIGSRDIVVTLKENTEDFILQLLENQLAKIDTCTLCGVCVTICLKKAITVSSSDFRIIDEQCDNCMDCVKHVCPHIISDGFARDKDFNILSQ